MANPLVTPNMSLTEPGIGNTLSPTWAQDLNADMGIIDQHNHAPGSGVQITPAGININQDLPFLDHNAVGLRSTRYQPQSAPLSSGTDLGCVYVSGVDLYYNDVSGNQIRITSLGGVAGTPGSIANLVSPASASYVSGSSTFVWQSSSGVGANMDAATYILRYPSTGYPTPSGNYIALQAPASLTGGYALTLPGTVPSGNSFLQFNSSGALVQGPLISGGITSTNIASGTILGSNIASGTITASNILSNTLTPTQIAVQSLTGGSGGSIAFGTITGSGSAFSNIAAATISGANVISSPGFNGNVKSNGQFVAVSRVNATNPMAITRGSVLSGGGAGTGEGFTSSTSGTGIYNVVFTGVNTYADTPAITVTPVSPNLYCAITSQSASGFTVTITDSSFNGHASAFNFIAMGQL